MSKEVVYLDSNATIPLFEEVRAHVFLLMSEPLNPSSLHSKGRYAKGLIEDARGIIMRSLGIDKLSYDVVFTSSGTECNNMILQNFSDYHIFTLPTEHSSIMKTVEKMAGVTFLKINKDGVVDEDFLVDSLKRNESSKKIISICHANNETGVIQDIKKLAELAHEHGAIIHSDMVQSFGRISVDLSDLDVDIITISSHKIGGMLGAAAVIKKAEIDMNPLILGGGQERGFRSGTENVYAISSFGKAVELIDDNISAFKEIKGLRDYFETEIQGFESNVKIYSKNSKRLPNTSYITMPGIESKTQLMSFDLRGFCVSAGAACSSGVVGESHVLKAMDSEGDHNNAIRISLCVNNTKSEIDSFIKAWKSVYMDLTQKGVEINYG